MFGGPEPYKVKAVFQNAGQLVPGNEVRVGGQPIGTISDIELDQSANAIVTMEVGDAVAPLHEGTSATIRATSLSGITSRYISLKPGPNNAQELEDGDQHRLRRDERAGGPRHALQHARREDARGPAQLHPRVRHAVRGTRRGGRARASSTSRPSSGARRG